MRRLGWRGLGEGRKESGGVGGLGRWLLVLGEGGVWVFGKEGGECNGWWLGWVG